MSLVNQLIAKARLNPPYLEVPYSRLNSLTEHAHISLGLSSLNEFKVLRQAILDGKVKMCGIPLKIIGIPSRKDSPT